MTITTDITIVGAGPYGLSIAAHLREQGLDFRIIGKPMHSWLTKMPKGMQLKSPGFASTLYDPAHSFTLREFCESREIPYQEVDLPIALETFISYGMAFQERLVPDLEDEKLIALDSNLDVFELRMASGELFKTRNVVLATGMDYFRHIPEQLAHLPRELCSHSADHHDLSKFQGREIAVVGAGASAIDIATLLHEAQAKVHLVARRPTLDIGDPWATPPRTLLRRMRAPLSGIGPGWRSRFYTDAPWLYRYFSDGFRLRTANFIGPSGGWFMKERAALVPCLLRHEVKEATASGSRVHLRLAGPDGSQRLLNVDHVIAATGYKNDVRRLPFLSPGILERLRLIGQSPRLSANFESSVPGLYFVGPVTTANFGPVMRFAMGAGFTSHRLSKRLARSARPASGTNATVQPEADTVSGDSVQVMKQQ